MIVLRQCQKCGGNPSDRDYGQEYWVECEACGFSPGKFKNRFCADVEWNSPIAPTQGADARPVAWESFNPTAEPGEQTFVSKHREDAERFNGKPLVYATRDAAPIADAVDAARNIAERFTLDTEPERRANLQRAIEDAIRAAIAPMEKT